MSVDWFGEFEDPVDYRVEEASWGPSSRLMVVSVDWLELSQSTDGSDSRLIGAGSEDSWGLNQSAERGNQLMLQQSTDEGETVDWFARDSDKKEENLEQGHFYTFSPKGPIFVAIEEQEEESFKLSRTPLRSKVKVCHLKP